MSSRDDCCDNATVENSLETLKGEHVHHRGCTSEEETRGDSFDYVEVLHNRPRLHEPCEYENHCSSSVRLLHRSVTINIRGESYRLKDKRKAGLLGHMKLAESDQGNEDQR